MEKIDDLELKLIKGSKDFTEEELRDLAFEYSFQTDYEEPRRWTRTARSVIKVNERLFALNWEKALTENQEHQFDSQPYEVIEEKQTIEVINYIKK